MSEADIDGLMALKDAAGWNQTAQDWRNVMAVEPEGCWVYDLAGAIVASTTAVCYGRDLAWIGMVLTHPDHRGKGYARALMEHAIAWLEARRVAWIKLDATDMGAPLYRKLGFQDETPIERWQAECRVGFSLRPASAGPIHEHLKIFGADRSRLLQTLIPFGSTIIDGAYALWRPGSKAAYFGPCVAPNPHTAARLLDAFLSAHPGEPLFWDILPQNTAAVELARARGFTPARRLMRMARPGVPDPPPFHCDYGAIYAIAGFEYG